jgi:glycerophosphoryl diester phosphodiesterase
MPIRILVLSCAIVTILGIVGDESAGSQGPAARTHWLIAHRGASAYAPENTIPAFTLAAEQGATFV